MFCILQFFCAFFLVTLCLVVAVQPCIGWIPILKKDAETLFAVHVIMSEHVILELINSVSNSFEYGTFILGINIIYFPKVLDT